MSEHNRNWWAGVADITASGLNHGALKVERIHLSIADETFNILQRVPIALVEKCCAVRGPESILCSEIDICVVWSTRVRSLLFR